MKTRKTNRAKQVAGSCSNHGSCPVCVGNRTYANRHAEPAPDNGLDSIEDDGDDDYSYLCVGCRAPLGNPKYHRFGATYCSLRCACSDAYVELVATPLVARLFEAVSDRDFVPMTDGERAAALKRGREDQEAADAELPGVSARGRYR